MNPLCFWKNIHILLLVVFLRYICGNGGCAKPYFAPLFFYPFMSGDKGDYKSMT